MVVLCLGLGLGLLLAGLFVFVSCDFSSKPFNESVKFPEVNKKAELKWNMLFGIHI